MTSNSVLRAKSTMQEYNPRVQDKNERHILDFEGSSRVLKNTLCQTMEEKGRYLLRFGHTGVKFLGLAKFSPISSVSRQLKNNDHMKNDFFSIQPEKREDLFSKEHNTLSF